MFEIQMSMKEVPDHVATGGEFRKQRMLAGLYQADVARMMGVQPSVLSALENGKRKWTEQRRVKAMEALQKMVGAPAGSGVE
jgi:predicted transcriptional regulator